LRYPTAEFVYVIWLTLRSAYRSRSEGQTFSPEWPYEEVHSRLSAAVARPRAAFGGVEAHPTFFEKVAAVGHAISSGHCFGNGNKRTAFVTMMSMLTMNGWAASIPAEITAFMMLRSATNENRMQVAELADFIASFAFVPTNDLKHLRHTSDWLFRNGLIEIVGNDPFPMPYPATPRSKYIERMQESTDRNTRVISASELAELQGSFKWPVKLVTTLTRWQHVSVYNRRRKMVRRTREKRCGKRRRPHCGGRTVSKICRPITIEKMRLKPELSRAEYERDAGVVDALGP
jgi:death-on-curing protein